MSLRCGIDLGTTCSAISWYNPDNRRVEIVELDHTGARELPSVVYFEPGGRVIVGDMARNAAWQYPDRVVVGIKQSMLGYSKLPLIDGRQYTSQEVAAEIFKALKKSAELFFHQDVTDIVIAVPAYFERQQLLKNHGADLLSELCAEVIVKRYRPPDQTTDEVIA
jgi:molecular chaperone HscC